MKRKAVFLDRDGVINKTELRDGKARTPRHVEEFQLFDGVEEAARLLQESGYLLIVVTNQPDAARGWISRETVHAMNDIVRQRLNLHHVKVCWHLDEHGCECRKPKPGMLLEAAAELGIDLEASFMVGDRLSDVAAGRAAGCRTILVECQWGKGTEGEPIEPDFAANSLLEATRFILSFSESN